MTRPLVTRMIQTCPFIPAQWEGKTNDHRPIYIRAKRGVVSASIGPQGGSMLSALKGDELARILDERADFLTSADMVLLLAGVLDFSTLAEIEPFDEWATEDEICRRLDQGR